MYFLQHRSKTLHLLFALLLGLGSAQSLAVPVTWTLMDVNFVGGGALSGSFVFDADTGSYSDFNITATASAAEPAHLGLFNYTPATATQSVLNDSKTLRLLSVATVTYPLGPIDVSDSQRVLSLAFGDPLDPARELTNAGGVVGVFTPIGGVVNERGGLDSMTGANFRNRNVLGGGFPYALPTESSARVVAMTAPPMPVPTGGMLVAFGLGALMLLRRRMN